MGWGRVGVYFVLVIASLAPFHKGRIIAQSGILSYFSYVRRTLTHGTVLETALENVLGAVLRRMHSGNNICANNVFLPPTYVQRSGSFGANSNPLKFSANSSKYLPNF